MSKGMQKVALLALTMWGMASAGGGKSSDANGSQGSNAGSGGGQTTVSDPSAGQGSNGNGNGSGQGETTSNPNSDGKDKGMQRKQARAARHADVDKARQQAVDSLRAAFARHEAAEVAGSSEIVNEKAHEKAAN